MEKYLIGTLMMISIMAIFPSAFAAPGTLMYQGRIINTQGEPLEYQAVSFAFTILNPSGSCVIYREQVSGVDMRNSRGVFDVAIGLGSKSYPPSVTFSLLDAFNNDSPLTCDGGVVYTPMTGDGRVLRVQFHDGSGWKLITPDSVIRSVPYAGFALSSNKLGDKTKDDFFLKTHLPAATCLAGEVITFDGTSFSCVVDNNVANSSVTTIKIADDAVTADKISDASISLSHLAAASAPGEVLQYDAGGWHYSKIAYTDLVNVNGLSPWPAVSCTSTQFLSWSSATDSFTCANFSLTGTSATIASAASAELSIIADTDGSNGGPHTWRFKAENDGPSINGGMTFYTPRSGNFLTLQAAVDDPGASAETGIMFKRASGAPFWFMQQRRNANDDFWIEHYDGSFFKVPLMISNATNFVGIGTTSPTAPLHIGHSVQHPNPAIKLLNTGAPSYEHNVIAVGTSDGADNQSISLAGGGAKMPNRGAFFQFSGNEAAAGEKGAAMIFAGDAPGNATDGSVRLFTGNLQERLIVNYVGDVGIGTSSPSYKLHVNGSVAGTGAYNALSDRRLKTNIRNFPNGLDIVLNLRGVRFDWRKDEYPKMNFDGEHDVGVIAQEVEAVLPEAVHTGKDGFKTVGYTKLIAPMIEAIKELKNENAELKTRLERQEKELSQIKERLGQRN